MSGSEVIGLIAAFFISGAVIGFVMGWTANPSDGHD
jgi:hypothetical protein